jgi:hypothetical protein
MKIDLAKWGEHELSPCSIAISFELVVSWTNATEDIAQLARICAAAIGVTSKSRFPRYRPSVHRPSEYGHICLERLLEAGITSTTILQEGTKILQWMSTQLPTESEVETEADFLPKPPPEDSNY